MLDWISSDSRRALLLALKRRGTLTIDDAASEIDRAVSTVREHLHDLADRGWVERETASPEGRGRPKHRYRLTDAGEALFPARDAELMQDLLAFLHERDATDLLSDFFQRFWRDRTERVQHLFNAAHADSRTDRLRVLGQVLEDEGFMPDIHESDGSVVIRECNCPFPESVKATRLPCKLEAEFLESVLDRTLSRVEYIPDGHDACTYTFSTDASAP